MLFATLPLTTTSMHEPASSLSIWAPQPQSSEMTWPKTLESFSKVAEKQSSSSMTMTNEDMTISNEVGAIGDGRKKPSSEFDNTVSSNYLFIFFIIALSSCSM